MTILNHPVFIILAGLSIGSVVGYLLRRQYVEGHTRNIHAQSKQIIENAIIEAEQLKKESLLQSKEEAYQWIRALKPFGSTYIDGALRLAFKVAGLENFDRAYPDIHVDTMVLLSDGAPTTNDFNAKNMDPQIILDHVAEWNKRKHVVIHCIGVDMVEGIQFLKDLAAQNGGTYVDR